MFELTVQETPAKPWTREYWLRHCEAYRVETPGGRLGFVETVFFSQDDEPAAIAVRTGGAETQIVLVSVEAVEQIRPDCETVVLRHVG